MAGIVAIHFWEKEVLKFFARSRNVGTSTYTISIDWAITINLDQGDKVKVEIWSYQNNWGYSYDSITSWFQGHSIDGGTENKPAIYFYGRESGGEYSLNSDSSNPFYVLDELTKAELDSGTCFNGTTGIFTAPRDGIYFFETSLEAGSIEPNEVRLYYVAKVLVILNLIKIMNVLVA